MASLGALISVSECLVLTCDARSQGLQQHMRRVKLSTFMQRNFSFGCQWSEADYLHLHKPSRVGKSPHPVNTSREESILNSKCVYGGMRQIESYQMHQVSKCSVDRFIPIPIGHLAFLIRVLRLIWASIVRGCLVGEFMESVAPTTTLPARSAPGFVWKWFRLGMDYNALDFPNRLSPKKKEQRVVQRFKMWKEKFPTCIRISNKLSLSYHMQSVGL